MRINQHILGIITTFALASSVIAQETVSGGYSFREIVIPGLSNLSANAINNSGTVVGTSDSGPFIWRHGRLETISIPGATSVTPSGINGLGKVVGSYLDEQNIQRPFLRERDGRVVTLPWGPTGENPGSANGINALGTIVGDSLSILPDGSQAPGSAIISTRRGMNYFDLDAPGVSVTRLRGINAWGNMVGQAILSERFSSGGFFLFKSAAFIVDRGGPRLIESPWPWVTANGINARNTVVGSYIAAPGPVAENNGFILASGIMTTVQLTSTNDWSSSITVEDPDLGPLRFRLNGVGTAINGINDRGEIVAVSFASYVNRSFFIFLTPSRSFVGTPGHDKLSCTTHGSE